MTSITPSAWGRDPMPSLPPTGVYFQTLRGVNRYKSDWHQAARSQDDWHRSTFVTGDRLILSQANYEAALALALSFPPGIDSAMFVGRVLTHYPYH